MVSAAGLHPATGDDTDPEPKPIPRVRPAYVEPPPSSVLPYIGLGVALIGGAGTTIFFLDARRARADANARYVSDPAFATDRSRFRVERTVGYVFTGVGAIGVGLALYGWLRHDREPGVQVGVGAIDGGGLLSIGGAL